MFLCLAIVAFNSCSDNEDIKLPTITVNFASTETGFDSENATEDITLNLSRVASADVIVELSYTATGVEYGTHFTTTPPASNNKISVTISARETSKSFTISKAAGIFLEGNESVKFTAISVSSTDDVKLGDKVELLLTFGSIVSAGGTMTLEGNGSENYINSVYVDLSSNKQTAVNRKSWNLGFNCGNDFKVILNGAYATAATPSTKTDITAVTIDDANAVDAEKSLNVNPMGGTFSETIFDKSDGSLDGTAFAAISANNSENFVYFVASADDKKPDRSDWYKVKIDRKDNGYTVQYARVTDTDIKTVDVPKKDGYNFTFLSLATGTVVDVEPQAAKWDIKWSYDAGYATSMGSPMYMFMQDFVSINNIGGISIAQVMTEDITYDNFKMSDINGLSFKTNRDVVGDKWRTVSMTPGSGGVKTDHFYVLKDSSGNYYKLCFTKFGVNDDAERGRPEIKYALVK
jgi:hypothetical protein